MEKYGSTDANLVDGLQTELLNIRQQIKDLHEEIHEALSSTKTAATKKTLSNLERRAEAIKEKISSIRGT